MSRFDKPGGWCLACGGELVRYNDGIACVRCGDDQQLGHDPDPVEQARHIPWPKLWAHVLGALSKNEHKGIAAHLTKCEACQNRRGEETTEEKIRQAETEAILDCEELAAGGPPSFGFSCLLGAERLSAEAAARGDIGPADLDVMAEYLKRHDCRYCNRMLPHNLDNLLVYSRSMVGWRFLVGNVAPRAKQWFDILWALARATRPLEESKLIRADVEFVRQQAQGSMPHMVRTLMSPPHTEYEPVSAPSSMTTVLFEDTPAGLRYLSKGTGMLNYTPLRVDGPVALLEAQLPREAVEKIALGVSKKLKPPPPVPQIGSSTFVSRGGDLAEAEKDIEREPQPGSEGEGSE